LVGGGLALQACSSNGSGGASPKDAGPDGTLVIDSGGDAADAAGDADDGGLDASDGGPAEASLEAGAEASVGCNATNCGGACCGDKCLIAGCGTCDAGTTFCPAKPSLGFRSNGVCVPDCSSCVASADPDAGIDASAVNVQCTSCLVGSPASLCATGAAQCPSDSFSGACSCATAGGTCQGSNEVCVVNADAGTDGGLCLRCGQTGTDGVVCSGEAACQASSATCL
jgi:hypothetical protein